MIASLFLAGCTDIHPNGGSAESYVVIAPQGAVSKDNYPYSELTEKERTGYDMLLSAVKAFEPTVDFPDEYTAEEIHKLFVLVYNQESDIFWLDSLFSRPSDNGILTLSYRFDADEVRFMRTELGNITKKIIDSLPQNSSDYEKILAFHDHIILGCDFSDAGEYTSTAYGVLADGKARCEGYAFAFSYLCDKAGIQNYIATGLNSDGLAHAWNKVLLDGEWYNLDCTWDDPMLEKENPYFLRHDYMLLPDKDIIGISHFPNEEYFAHIPCTGEKYGFFINEELYFQNADEAAGVFLAKLDETAKKGGRNIEMRLSSAEEYQKCCEILFDESAVSDKVEELNGIHGCRITSLIKNTNDELNVIHISLFYKGDE